MPQGMESGNARADVAPCAEPGDPPFSASYRGSAPRPRHHAAFRCSIASVRWPSSSVRWPSSSVQLPSASVRRSIHSVRSSIESVRWSIAALVMLSLWVVSPALADDRVLFNRDIRPILSDTCFKCHGFDANTRKAELRLDTPEGASKDLGGGVGAIVPGKPDESEAFRRLMSDDEEEMMPPHGSGITLTKPQVELVRRWIEQGAQYERHWSLIPATQPAEPAVNKSDWARNPIDKFILARLEQAGMQPSPEADRVTLIRRVTLDLTG